jgi:hypothetical protein
MMSNLKHIGNDIDYLIPLIFFLGSNPYWWARSPQELAAELSLDETRVSEIFARYSTIFRRSEYDKEEKRYYYSLQMRYAQRKDGKTKEPPKVSAFPVLSESEIIALITFLMQISSNENTARASRRTSLMVVCSAVVSALSAIAAAVLAAYMKTGS